MIDRRAMLGGALGAVAAVGLAGCSEGKGSSEKGPDAVPASWAVCRIGEPGAIDSLLARDRAGVQIARAVFSPLTRITAGQVVPAAATRFEVSEDARTFTFHLIAGARFHDGEPVTASSFKRAWERLVRPLEDTRDDTSPARQGEPAAARHSRWCALLSSVDGYDAMRSRRASELVGLRCPDDLTLVVSLTEPCSDFAALASHPALGPIPTCALDDARAYASKPVGNGPFELVEPWKVGEDIRLARFDECATGAPLVEGVRLFARSDTGAAYGQFQAGNLDICDLPIGQLEDMPEASFALDSPTIGTAAPLVQGVEPGLTYLVCNTHATPFDRAEFRHAVSCAIDREALCRKALNHSAAPAYGPVSPCLGEAAPWEVCSFDAERAKELIESLLTQHEGASTADGESATQAPGPAGAAAESSLFDFALLCRKGGVQGRIASQIAKDLKDVGVGVRVDALDQKDLEKRFDRGDFTCGLATFDPVVPTAEAVVTALFAPSSPRMTWTGYESAGLSKAVDHMRESVEPVARRQHVDEALELAGEDLLMIPLIHPAYAKVASDRVESANLEVGGDVDLASVRLI